MDNHPLTKKELIRLVFSRLIILLPAMFAMFFLPAGTLLYWEAWVYLATLLIPMLFVLIYLFKNDPELLERRMRMKEKETPQKLLIRLTYLYFLAAFLLPGFDHRFGWSDVPYYVVIIADVIVLGGYLVCVLVFRENSYASRIIEVEQEQQVISSGPYAIVRHPMYLGVMLMYIASPLGLGSYWAIIPAVLIIPILVARILNEERVLARELKGYEEYMLITQYRLIPRIW